MVTISKALAEPGSPGRAFKLTDAAVNDLLKEAAATTKVFTLGSSAGLPQLVLSLPSQAAMMLLRQHYRGLGADLNWDPRNRIAVA